VIVDDDKRPYWIDETLKDEKSFLLAISDKWKAINNAILKSKEIDNKKS
jgi:hypothetical protein